MNTEKQTLILAALLHDIGKFYQRALGEKRTHTELGREVFINNFRENLSKILTETEVHLIESAIGNHHEYEKFITYADWLSAGMDRIPLDNEEKGDPASERLASIFEKISLDEEEIKKDYSYFYDLKYLSMEYISPQQFEKENLSSYYNTLFQSFINELKNLPLSNINIYTESLFYLLLKYTWCVPSAVYKDEPDISLFDHLKTTAAITACLYETNNKDSFLLIYGDISGIQKFIYKLASPDEAQRGQAQRLRGRSFYLALLNETFAQFILRELDLPITNLLWCGGGHFLILAPNIPVLLDNFNICNSKINLWLYNKFQADLYLALATLNINKDGLLKFSESLTKLQNEINKIKKKKIFDVKEREFELKKDVCIVCGTDFNSEKDEKICNDCNLYEKIGERLPKVSYLIESNTPQNIDEEIKFDDFKIYWSLSNSPINAPKNSRIYKINDTNFLNNNLSNSTLGFKFIANIVAKNEKGEIMTFEEMQSKNEGAKFLGILKTDIDNLGAIFNLGLKGNISISRVATLSRAFDFFFLGYLNNICKNYETIYITYSGGDDLFIVGGWEEIVKVSQEISNKFKEYVCNNKHLHLSSGIFLCKHKFPIGRAAEVTTEKLNVAKGINGKNAICVFENVTNWQIFDEIIKLGDELIKAIKEKDKKLSKGFIYTLLELSQMHIKEKKEELIWLPKFLYSIKRNIENEDLATLLKTKILKLRHQIPILVSYVLLRTRKE